MKRIVTAVIFVSVLATITCLAQAAEIRIVAGAAPSENIFKPIAGPFEKATGIKLIVTSSGPPQAIIDLERGAAEVAAAGLSQLAWLELMKKEGKEVKDPASLKGVVIGKDRIVVITHKDNTVKKLTKEQLQGIFSGAIASWKDVGGPDLPTLVVWGKLIQGTNKTFVEKIMDGKEVTKDVLEATTADDVKQNVVNNPSAVGIGPVSAVDATVNAPEIPEIGRDITLMTKGDPSANVQKLLDFIKGEGQKYVKK
jgi:phosphate transport system substrate-binding protein